MLRVLCVILICALAACGGAGGNIPWQERIVIGQGFTAEVSADDWHAGIVLRREAVAATGLLPEIADFPDAAYLEFGWGDRTYYPSRDKTLAMTLAAALTDTPAIMHVAGFWGAAAEVWPGRETIEISLDAAAFERLVAAIAGTFERLEGERAEIVSGGLYPGSHFYNASGSFHLLNTCNTWVARMLAAAGVPVRAEGIVTAGDLMGRLRAVAEGG
jgi:uncharacterized protein (TIGR02117 family)